MYFSSVSRRLPWVAFPFIIACDFPALNQAPVVQIQQPVQIDPADPLVATFQADAQDPDGEILSYQWDFGDATTGGGEKAVHRYSEKGIYFVVLSATDDDGATSRTPPTRIVIQGTNEPPVARIRASVTAGVAPLTVVFDGSESSDSDPNDIITSYTWTFGEGEGNATGRVRDHRYRNPGTFEVVLSVTDNFGGVDSTSIEIEVFPRP